MKVFRGSWLLIFLLSAVFSVFGQNRERSFDVQHYIIRTSFDRPSKTVNGDTTVRLGPLAYGFKGFSLDAVNLQVQSVILEETGKPLIFSSANNKLNITLDRAYAPADLISVRIKYRIVKPKAGIYFVDALKKDGTEIRAAQIWSQGEAEENRYWFPSYDFPDDKATSEQFITTTTPDETAIANGELVEVKTNEDKTKTFHYRMNVPHSSYLTSLVIGKYTKVEDKHQNVPLGFYVYPGTESIVKPAYGKTGKMIALYQELLGVRFPYNKYDQTVVGAFQFGGMENITATTMADTEIYAAGEKGALLPATEVLVAHELAHSWFGDLVTCKNWANLWLNEGFATFFESVYLEREYGRDAYLNDLRNNAAQYFNEEPFLKHPLLNLRAQPNILLFDATTYKKGGYVVHMLRETVGEEMFWKSLNVYLNRHKFNNVETADLQRAFEDTTGKDLNWFFEQWVRKAGFPKLKIQPQYDAANKKLLINVTQTQEANSQTPAVFRFSTIVEIGTPEGTNVQKIEMTERRQTFTFDAPTKPLSITFDPREQVLKKGEIEDLAEFHTSTARKQIYRLKLNVH
ncbi:MAG: M1 family aminopeptidase [Pyrinomonadaceae bacterium]